MHRLATKLAAASLLGLLACNSAPPTDHVPSEPPLPSEPPKQEAVKGDPPNEAPKEEPPRKEEPRAEEPVNAPEVAAKRYLVLGAKGDLSKLRELLDPACENSPVADVNAVKMLGARMTLDEVQTSVGEVQGDITHVNYTVKGSITAQESHTETNLGGQKIEIKASSISMEGVTQSGSLPMKKLDGAWVVTCP
jgi:hypothetical protein